MVGPRSFKALRHPLLYAFYSARGRIDQPTRSIHHILFGASASSPSMTAFPFLFLQTLAAYQASRAALIRHRPIIHRPGHSALDLCPIG